MNNIVLFEPEIPQNTGNIMRTCAATGAKLHLIRPLGFRLDQSSIKRSGVNYIDKVEYTLYDDYEDFCSKNPGEYYYMTRYGKKAHSEFDYSDKSKNIYLIFGKESTGIPKEILVFAVTPGVLQRISDVEQPQGVVFTCQMPGRADALSGSRFLALDNLRDPGNLGTILRSAEAFGLDGVVLLGDCVDLWAPKTLRSAMGSAFRVPVYRLADAAQLKAQLAELGVPMYAAALYSDSRSVVDTDLRRACVVIGNEAHGVSDATLEACDGSLIIPIHTAESLNAAVAAAVFAWEMSRQSMEARG